MKNSQSTETVSEPNKNTKTTNKSDSPLQRITGILAIVASVVGAVVAMISFFQFDSSPESLRSAKFLATTTMQTEQIAKEIGGQQALINELKASLDAIVKMPEGTDMAVQIAAIRGNLSNIDTRLSALETAIIENPAKALSLPLLRAELNNLKSNSQRDIEASTKQMDRIYDQNKWFIGLMFTMVIALIGLAVSNFLQARKSSD